MPGTRRVDAVSCGSNQHRDAERSESLVREAPDLLEGHARYALGQRFEMSVATRDLEERELVDPAALVVQVEGQRGAHLVDCSAHVGLGPGLRRGHVQRAEQGSFRGGEPAGLRHGGRERVHVGIGRSLPVGAHGAREARGRLIEDGARSPGVRAAVPGTAQDPAREATATGQERVEEDESREVGIGEGRSTEGHDDLGMGTGASHGDALRSRRRGLDRAHGRRFAGRGQRAEASLHLGQDHLHAHVSGYDEDRVVGLVVATVEGVGVVPGQAFDIRQPADRVVAVGWISNEAASTAS
jgi:hypothetical protein